jgi:signal transduction histidine kinase
VAGFAVLSAGAHAARETGARRRGLAALLLLSSVPLLLLVHTHLGRLTADWDGYWAERESAVYGDLTTALESLVAGGDETVTQLADLAARSGGRPDWEAVDRLRGRSGFPAVAVYGPDGVPTVWAGVHRGRVPEAVQFGASHYLYGELPLFSYLYFTERIPETGGTAVVAAMVRSDLPESLRARPGDFVSRFRRTTGEDILIARAERVGGRAAFDFVWDTETGPDTLFSVSVLRPAEMERREDLRGRWLRVVLLLAGLVWFLLATADRDPREARTAMAALIVLAVLLPLDVLVGGGRWLRLGDFHLVLGPLEASLGRVLIVALGVVGAGALWRGRSGLPGGVVVSGLAVALLFPWVARGVTAAAAPGFLAGPEAGWAAFQLVLSILLSLVAGCAVATSGRTRSRPRGSGSLAAGVVVALLFAAVAAWGAGIHRSPPLWWLPAWGLPAVLMARGLGSWVGWRRSALLWLSATVLGTSAALPVAWHARIEARMSVAEEQMRRLASDVDPYLDFLLGRLAESVRALQLRGAGPVELLYRGWLDSGLAREGHPVWLTLWGPGGLPQEEFPIGVSEGRPGVAGDLAELVRGEERAVVRRLDLPDAHYVVAVPLTDGSVVTGVVPPLKEIGPDSPLGPLFGNLSGEQENPLTLVPLLPDDVATYDRSLRWARTTEGWQGRVLLGYPDQRFHAHYLVELPGAPVLVARATLLLVLNLGVLFLVWAAVRALVLGGRPTRAELQPLVSTFRSRVTGALFGFFLLSIAIFGTLAYRTISGAAERAARVLAERVAQDAGGIYNEMGGQMELLGRQVGADLLEYREGELREGSTEELVELGLFEGWLPWPVHRRLTAREDLLDLRESRLGQWEYVTAFRRLPDGDILAAPVPLRAGATAVRREEVAHLLGFAVVAGALLSLVLALLVGRTLAQPIRTLQVASERVGAGNLGVRIPADRTDEFGSVFSAFNRMVRRLRRARRELLRTTRRTQAIVEDAATGVMALDASGRVTLANSRAGELLARDIEVGERLEETGGAGDEFVRWVRLYFRDGLGELGGEFQFGEQRVRVRARRIERDAVLGGAVVILEDVTDELRTERVLAWGEMARQVAHEVKNPLTPIKLAIQHIRRAWDDRRPEFGEILTRNAEAALDEIDRLASIASSFSRFGAPMAAGEAPLAPVALSAVVGEVLALYQSGEGHVVFENDVSPDLPAVLARGTEVKEVLVNLLENARAAIEEEGRVRVGAREGAHVVILTVEDDGVGIDAELLSRIFEPHFSTRSAGTGLGLAIVKRLVESWEGTVSVESRRGRGTEFHLRLRVWNAAPEGVFEAADEGKDGDTSGPDGTSGGTLDDPVQTP